MSAVAKLNETLFENSDKIPEGLYLELMNLTKEVFNDRPEPITIRTTTIKYTEPEIYKIGRIQVNPRDIYQTPSIAIYDARGFRIINSVEVRGIFELMAYGNDKDFYEVKKINKCSVKIVRHLFHWDIGINQYKLYDYKLNIKIAEKDGLNEVSGVMWLDLSNKNISFYGNFSQEKIHGDFNTALENTLIT